MPVSWDRVAESAAPYQTSDFARAASRLMHEQVLYQADARQRRDYELVAAYEGEFNQALKLFGCALVVAPHEGYAAAVPEGAQFGTITVNQAYLALVLRKLYHLQVQDGTLDRGIAGISLPELIDAYKESTGRDLPQTPRAELDVLFDVMRRWGIARLRKPPEEDPQPYYVEILPGIQTLLNERALAQLKAQAESQFEPKRAATAATGATFGADGEQIS